MPQNRAKNREAAEYGGGNDGIAVYAYVEGSFGLKSGVSATFIAGLIEAVPWIAVGGKNGDFMSKGLKAYGSIYDKTLRTTDA